MQPIRCKHAYAVRCIPCGCEYVFINTVKVLNFVRETSRIGEPYILVIICIEKERADEFYRNVKSNNHSKLSVLVHTRPQSLFHSPFSPLHPFCPPDGRSENSELRARNALRCDNLGNLSKTYFESQNFLLVPIA